MTTKVFQANLKVVCLVSHLENLKKGEVYTVEHVEIDDFDNAFFHIQDCSLKHRPKFFDLMKNRAKEIFTLDPPLKVQARASYENKIFAGEFYHVLELRLPEEGGAFFRLEEILGGWLAEKFTTMAEVTDFPHYKHDCPRCIFLGKDKRWRDGRGDDDEDVDLWVHFNHLDTSLIRRFGSSPKDTDCISIDELKKLDIVLHAVPRSRWTAAAALAFTHIH